MALNRYGKPQIQYNTKVEAEYKPYLPIIGNEIPGKSLGRFDDLTQYTVTGDTDMGLDASKAYRADNCRHLSIAASAVTTLTYEPNEPLDLLSLEIFNNNFAHIKKTGKYKTGGTSLKDTLHLVLNIGHYYTDSSSPATFKVKFYSGTKTATLTSAATLANRIVYNSQKYQFALNEDVFTFENDFEIESFSAVDKIDIAITQRTNTLLVYFHEIWSALPQYSATVTDAYYPQTTTATSIYLSWLFGDDANSGATRGVPVKTLGRAISLLTPKRLNLVIIDSEKYKPVSSGYVCGVKDTIQDGARIIADYLETPEISSESGVFNEKIGARKTGRYHSGAANITVGASGADYTTITAAYAAATSENIIEIIDDGVYDEAITINKSITIRAAHGKMPRWIKTTSGFQVTFSLTATEIFAKIQGIEFYGRGANSDGCMTGGTNAGANINRINIEDCTFTNFGLSTGTIICRLLGAQALNTIVNFDSCLFVENGVSCCFYAHPGCQADVFFRNCKAFMNNSENTRFISYSLAPDAGGATFNVSTQACEIYGATDEAKSLAMHAPTSGTSAGESSGNMFYTKCSARLSVGSSSDFFRARYCEFYGLKALVSGDIMNQILPDTQTYIDNNIFRDYIRGGTFASWVLYTRFSADNNIFANNYGIALYAQLDGATFNSNIFYQNLIAISGGAAVFEKSVFLENDTFANPVSGKTHTVNNSIIYDNTTEKGGSGGTLTVALSCLRLAPKFVAPEKLRFGYFPDSPINTLMAVGMNLHADFINTLGNDVDFMFLKIKGVTGNAFDITTSNLQRVIYSVISGWASAYNNNSGYRLDVLNCIVSGNDTGLTNGLGITAKNEFKNNIIINNGTGVVIRGAVTVEKNTIVNNGYGVYGLVSGYFSVKNYAENFVSVKDNIIFNNDVFDYNYNIPTSYCIIGTRYFDALDINDPEYAVTLGDGDINDNPLLTDDYFPALKVLGYKEDSPAHGAASDGGNIGARDESHIKAYIDYDSYTMPASPQDYIYSIAPVNVESAYTVGGDFESESDADVIEISLSWTDPGRRSKIMSAQKTVMEAVFETYWFIALSLDAGATWQYYKVKKDNGLSFKQAGYYYHELPWADVTIELVNIPDFNPTDYEVDTWA